jgi:hypothetical protein
MSADSGGACLSAQRRGTGPEKASNRARRKHERKEQISMSATTAQILLGNSHPNDCGMSPTHALYLHEGDRCSWSMHEIDLADSRLKRLAVWTPDPSQILADAILMSAFHAGGDGGFRKKLLSVFPGASKHRIDSFELALTDRLELLDMVKAIVMPKMVVSIFQGSSLKGQTRLLAEFPFDCEVCESVSYRIRSQWNPEPELGGEFAKAEPN